MAAETVIGIGTGEIARSAGCEFYLNRAMLPRSRHIQVL
jgi:hypothetical protein